MPKISIFVFKQKFHLSRSFRFPILWKNVSTREKFFEQKANDLEFFFWCWLWNSNLTLWMKLRFILQRYLIKFYSKNFFQPKIVPIWKKFSNIGTWFFHTLNFYKKHMLNETMHQTVFNFRVLFKESQNYSQPHVIHTTCTIFIKYLFRNSSLYWQHSAKTHVAKIR